MAQIELIEGMIAHKLELSGMKNEGVEGQCRSLLYHLYTAVELYRLMVPAEKQIAKEWHNVFAKDFRVNLFLKELKSKKNKEKTAPAPHRKEKNKKEKVQKTRHSDAHAKQDLEERKKAFWNELLKYENKYGRQMLLKFYYYWAEELENLNMMKWEAEKARKSFDIKCRLGIWSKRSYETDDKAADIHLERVKGKKSAKAAVNTQEEQAIAAKRAEDNEKLEQEIAERKQGAVSYEEYIRQKNEKKS
jgi:hypothetical protein